jgi:hypothetical protein
MVGVVLLASVAGNGGQTRQADRVVPMPYAEAQPILQILADILPAELRGKPATEIERIWPDWIADQDSSIRKRIDQGNQDSMVNFMVFGSSFTRQPRVTLAQLSSRDAASKVADLIQERAADLATALARPGTNERLAFLRELVRGQGQNPDTAEGRKRLVTFLLAEFSRMLDEQASYARILEGARQLGDPSAEFAERSKLYAARGLSADTSIFPNYAIEASLRRLVTNGQLAPGSVRRVAIVGPGLDFTDKQDGYDFYPQQTLQPFAVIDSLTRLGLAHPGLQVTTLDLNQRVNAHLTTAIAAARRGRRYIIQLPRDEGAAWTPEMLQYWQRFGDRIGTAARPVAVPPGLGKVTLKAVAVRPEVTRRLEVRDANIVLQRLETAPAERFDLVIATNILVYYDIFFQSLAMSNVARMLRPAGLLLSNNALLELPGAPLRSVGYETAIYSDREGDGDFIVFYQKPN